MQESFNNSNFEIKQKLPNATAVLVLGIFSIVTCCFYGIGMILGIVALVLAKKDTALFNENPQLFTNYSNIKTGKILAIIGIVLSVLFIAYIIWIISYFGIETLSNPQLLQEKIRQLQGK